jgi:hypothetical protein
MYFGVFKCLIAQTKTKPGVSLTAASANYRTSPCSAFDSFYGPDLDVQKRFETVRVLYVSSNSRERALSSVTPEHCPPRRSCDI